MTEKEKIILAPYESEEEFFFSYYLNELKQLGFIDKIGYNVKSFDLSDSVKLPVIVKMKTKVKVVDKHLLSNSVYTPDFFIIWNKQAEGTFIPRGEKLDGNTIFPTIVKGQEVITQYPFIPNYNTKIGCVSIFEVKPQHDFKNMTRIFKTKQKWMMQKHNLYVELIKPISLFKETFYPKRYHCTILGNSRKNYIPSYNINNYVKDNRRDQTTLFS